MLVHVNNSNYNLRFVSLIALVVKLGIKLQQFDEELRGGLLSTDIHGNNPLQYITCYDRDENTTNATGEYYSAVLKQLRVNNLFMKEDSQ